MSHSAESAGNWRGTLPYAAISDVGLRRANNQDAFVVSLAGDEHEWQARGHLFLVADGMGAHAAGELASKMACESIPHTYRKLTDKQPPEALRQAMVVANGSIHSRGLANPGFQGMGTTACALVMLPTMAIVGHIGDSRVYRLRNQTLEQLTFDHSLVWEMTAAGQMPKGDLAGLVPKNIITRSLGPHANANVDLEGPYPLQPGDVFLLCSDGLSGQVKDEEIGAILGTLAPQEAARVLVDISNLRGGPDNITALVVRADAPPAADEAPPPPVASGSIAGRTALAVVVVGLVAALGFLATEQMILALVSGAVAFGAFVASLVIAKWSKPCGAVTCDGPLGSGPHVTRQCTPSSEGVAMLCQMAQQLREVATEEHWKLDWTKFNAYGQRAQAALGTRDFALAMREYALAISFMMNEIRQQPAYRRRHDDSALEFLDEGNSVR